MVPLVLFRYSNATSSVPLQKQNEFELLNSRGKPLLKMAPKGADQGPQGGYAGAKGTTLASRGIRS